MSRAAFIAYSQEDEATALAICQFLESRGLSCWIAPRDVIPGNSYAEEIVRGIEDAGSMVVLVSSNSNRSIHVLREVEQALQKGKPIFPVVIEHVQLSRALNYYIAPIDWIVTTADALRESAETVASAVRGEANWKQAAVAPSRVRGLRYRGGAFVAALGCSLVSVAAGLVVVYLAWVHHSRALEAEINMSFTSLGYVDLSGQGKDRDGNPASTADLKVTVYLYVPDVRFRDVRLRIHGIDVKGVLDGDVSNRFTPEAFSPQWIELKNSRLSQSITTCLTLPRTRNGQQFRVTQFWRLEPQYAGILVFNKENPETVTPEDGSLCGTQQLLRKG